MQKEYSCPNCGAPLDGTGRCSYCGTVFERSKNIVGEVHYIAVGDPQAKVLKSDVYLDYDEFARLPEEYLAKKSIERITYDISKSLAEYLTLDVREDPVRRAKIISGSVRVLPPDFRF